jgi:type VI protein secretion system component Hcp
MAENARLFMRLDVKNGSWIKGEAAAKEFAEQIELNDWSWTLSRKTSGDDSASNALGEIEPSVFSFDKRMDMASTPMLTVMEKGQLCKATITLEEASEAEFEMKIVLDDIRIHQYELEGESDEKSGELKEKWVFNYRTIRFDYRPTGQPGAMNVELTRKAGASTEVPESGREQEQFERLALKLGQKTASDLFKGIDWKKPSVEDVDRKKKATSAGPD